MSETTGSSVKSFRLSPQNLFFILITLQFVVAPFYYQPNFGGEGLYLPYNSSIWIIAAWIIAAGAYLMSRSETFILPKYWFWIGLLPLGALTTGFIVETSNPTEWVTRLSVIGGGYLFFLSLFQFKLSAKQIDHSLYLILAMGMVAAAYAIFQIHSLSQFYPFIPRSNESVPIGIFQQVNIQASMMSTLLVLVYYLISRPSLLSVSLITKFSLCLTAFAASYVIAASGSRVGLLGIALALTLLIIGRWKLFTARKSIFSLLIICTLTGAGLQLSGLQKSTDKFGQAMGGMEADVRWKVYKISWDLFQESPLLGHGLGSFQKVFQEKRKDYQQKGFLHLKGAPRFSHPHNELLFWLVEGGIVAVMGILIAATVTFIQLFKIGWQRGSGYAALLLPITLHTQVELPFYTANTHWLLLLFLLFLTHQHGKKTVSITSLSVTANRLIPTAFIGIALLSTWVMLHSLKANGDLVKYFSSRHTKAEFLETPVNSFYFRDYAMFLSLRHKMLEGLKTQDAKPVVDFINYTENLIITAPAEHYYAELINAYNVLGETERRDKRLQDALGIYEASRRLLHLQKRFEKQTAAKTSKGATPDK